MLLKLTELGSFAVEALDGAAGSIAELHIDDVTWRVTHATLQAGSWLFGRKMLVRAADLGIPDLRRNCFRLAATHQQIEAMAPIEAPRSRTMNEFAEWQVEGPGADPGGAPAYHITDFLAEGCWRIRYVCVEVGDVLSPKTRAVPVQRLAPAHTEQKKLETPLVKSVIQNGPELGPYTRISRAQQLALEKYYAQFG